MKIGFLGPKGTFSQHAAKMYLKESDIEPQMISYGNFADLILGVHEKKIDEAVLPVENSIEGPVNITLDMLAWDVALKIKREIDLPIRHNVMVRDVNANITCILSHPQAIGQCRNFLNRYFPDIPIQYTYSTTQAAEKVAAGQSTRDEEQWAAIAAEKAAEAYDLKIIHRDIQDYDNNVTRFIVLSHRDVEKAEKGDANVCKTSIIFSTDDKPGSLYKILQILNLWDINMTKIESRPAKENLGSYIFFVDIEGHREDEHIKDALTMIKRKTSFFKMLGSYYTI